jgi:hypothetical protein
MIFKKLRIPDRAAAVVSSHFSRLTSHVSHSDQ